MSQNLCACGCGQAAPIAKKTDSRYGTVQGQPSRFIYKHQARKASLTHGMTYTREYRSYNCAKTRCNNPKADNYADYCARGIKFLFSSFEQFYAELGPRPQGKTLDRISSDGNYEPGNVRWATVKEQNNKQRGRVA